MKKNDTIKPGPFDRAQPINREFFNVPLLGLVIPDDPDYSNGKYDLNELVNNYKKKDINTFNLSILDNAMKNCGILEGDLLTVNLKAPILNQDIVVVKIGERVLVRKYFKNNKLIRLETDDDYPSDLIIEPDTPGFQILGKVVSVIREL